jgi:hypothetical protein
MTKDSTTNFAGICFWLSSLLCLRQWANFSLTNLFWIILISLPFLLFIMFYKRGEIKLEMLILNSKNLPPAEDCQKSLENLAIFYQKYTENPKKFSRIFMGLIHSIQCCQQEEQNPLNLENVQSLASDVKSQFKNEKQLFLNYISFLYIRSIKK